MAIDEGAIAYLNRCVEIVMQSMHDTARSTRVDLKRRESCIKDLALEMTSRLPCTVLCAYKMLPDSDFHTVLVCREYGVLLQSSEP